MKLRIITIMVLIAVTILGCKKEKQDVSVFEQEVSFAAVQIEPGAGFKSADDWLCPTDNNGALLTPTVAKVIIAGIAEPFWPAVFTLDGKLYTQAIKLPVAAESQQYTISFFGLYTAINGTLIMATPQTGSAYSEYTTTDVTFPITVTKFAKAEIPVEVLCYMPNAFTNFGFDWLEIDEIIIREQTFFGDFCMKHPADYLTSNYALQPGGLKIDMPAIFKIDAYKKVGNNWVLVPNNANFTNNTAAANYGVGAPVKVQYPDNLMITGEEFKFELWILVKIGAGFDFKLFHTWTFMDAQLIPAGTDKVVDFVLGSCNLSNTDLQLAPYMNLPEICNLLVGDGSAGINNTYINVTLSGIGPGYDIENGLYGVYCADQGHFIYVNTLYESMGVFSSLLPLPVALMEPQAIANIDQANWLMNHLSNYPAANMQDIQNALWKILDAQATFPSSIGDHLPALVTQMVADASANGNNFVPLPGGYAAVIFAKANEPILQIIFTVVDP